jgi:hypothetical protein
LRNLPPAVGLPGSAVDESEIPVYLDKLDARATMVWTGTERMLLKLR